MARRFTRRRWRRPERMTLEHPPVVRRKDLAVPELLELEPDLVRRHNRNRIALLDAAYVVLVLVEFAAVGLWLRSWPAFVVLAAGVLIGVARRHADVWLRHALGAHPISVPRVERLLRNLARASGIPAPVLFGLPGGKPNAIALGSRRPWIVVTTAALDADDLVLEGMLAHEIVHVRDGDAAVASAYALLAGAPDLAVRGFGAHAGVLAWLSLPVWPVALCLRFARGLWFAPDREHRADISAALLTRYPPGIGDALESASGERSPGLRLLRRFWFAPEDDRRAQLVAEM